jgi:hypothetical protein
MNNKVRQVLDAVVKRFETGAIPEAIALSLFPLPNIPAEKWSLLNRTLMFLVGTADARGYQQWKKVGRQVKKGAKAFWGHRGNRAYYSGIENIIFCNALP